MITEQASLNIIPGKEAEFEAAFDLAKSIIASMPGFHDLELLRGIESPSDYLLLVEWESVDHHLAFRDAEGYDDWRTLLHHFYSPFPRVEHFRPLLRVDREIR